MTEGARPVLRVVRGEPDEAELAALTAVVLAVGRRRGRPDEPVGPDGPRSAWTDRAARLRRIPHPGPAAWRTSALPH